MIRRLRSWVDRRRHPQRYAYLDALLPALALDRAMLLDRQRAAFADILAHARSQTAYYAGRLGGLSAADLAEPTRLPLLRKADVAVHRDAMLARDVDRDTVRLGHTGGSTGTPLGFYYTADKHERMLAGMRRGFMLSGWRPGERVLYLWGASRDVAGRGVFARAGAGLLDSELSLAATLYDEAHLADWADRIARWRPRLLYGYASALSELARYLVDTGRRLPLRLHGVYSTAEMLFPPQRALIERAFECKVFNQYGCREVPNIAWECRHGGMHVFADLVLLEAVPVGGEQHLVVTSLTDRVMPFIRYDTGDTGELQAGDCRCGLPFPLMRTTLCRQNDLVSTPDGARVHPAVFNRLLYGLSGVCAYQWVQVAAGRMRLDLVTETAGADGVDAQLAQRLGEALRREVHPAMQLEVRRVDHIPRTAAGKHRYVIGLGARPAASE